MVRDVSYLPPAPLTPGTQQAGRWRRPFTDSAMILLIPTMTRSPPLTREAAGVSLCSLSRRNCGQPDQPAGLAGKGTYLLCWVFRCQRSAGKFKSIYLRAKRFRISRSVWEFSGVAVAIAVSIASCCFGVRYIRYGL